MAGFWNQSNTQIHDMNGKPLIGAKAYFYEGGTTTPLNIYGSYSLGAVNALPNPVVTDGSGFFPAVFLDEDDEFYRVRITTAGGVIVYDVDGLPIIGPNAGGGGGGEAPVNPDAVLTTGDMMARYGEGLRAGFVRANGRTIGSATSGASERANSDAQALFEHLWNADANLTVVGGRGGSSSADWGANKQITLPDFRGRATIGMDTMGNSAANVVSEASALGWSGGAKTHTLTTSEVPAHNHGVNDPGHDHGVVSGLNGSTSVAFAGAGGIGVLTGSQIIDIIPALTGISTQNAGGGAAHNNLQPSLATTIYIRL